MAVNARTEKFQHLEVFDKPALFTNGRIARDTVPKGWYCYDIRGSDDDPGELCYMEENVVVNHAGSVLMPEKLAMPKSGRLDVRDELGFLDEGNMTLREFCEAHQLPYPAENMKFHIRPARPEEAGLFYTPHPEEDKRLGAVGCVRMDFGRSGNEFWHTWWPRGPEELNSPVFKAELQEVVDTLRESVLKSRFAMERFCYEHGGKISGGWTQNYGYIVETAHYRYCLRCNPSPGDYNGYLTCFDLNVQRQNMARDKPLVGRVTYANGDTQEFIDLHGVSGALMATTNMQMQTFVTQPDDTVEGFDGYNGDLTGDVAATLGTNCGMSTGRNGVMAFAANQRDEVRDLHDVAGALNAQPGMKQQTFVAAAFSAGAGASAGSIGYGEELAPTLKGSASGNCMPSVLCLNDQGGSVMECSENVSGTLRAQEHGHQPLVYENHGIDARYTGPHQVAPTMSARYGTGGNNVPLVEQEETFCITGNAIDRQPQNGGNGIGYQRDIAYTLTATDHHAVYSRQRVDDFRENGVVSTQSARQHKDATDLVCQKAEAYAYLIRRLTPLECERLQGFPDGWTDIPDASDSARYKALGNSVAIPCVEFIMGRIAAALRAV